MNAYDFDDTILEGDTERYFWKWIWKRCPEIKNYYSEFLFYKVIQDEMGLIPREDTRPHVYAFLNAIDNIDEIVEDFWDAHQKFIKPWYKDIQREDDVIISASPEFLLIPICKRLGINRLIATPMDKKTGKLFGKYNYYTQKVIRFKELYGNISPECFYSDSESDRPMAEISQRAVKVVGNKLLPWDICKV